MDLTELQRLIARGESKSLELKRTTGELREALKTLCGFLNSSGGRVLFGVDRKGTLVGQQVSEQTLHKVTTGFARFEPPAVIHLERVEVGRGREVLVLAVEASHEGVPFTFDGRAFERIGNTTRKMSQERYETLLLQRAHARRRWENQPAVDVEVEQLDREEILLTRETAVRERRISAETSAEIGDVLDRLGLRRDGTVTQAALVLYGTRFLPDYPQCMLKMGRFRGTTVTGDILDNRQEYLNAFAVVREGMAFLDRTLPLSAHFKENEVFREDRLAVPPAALRELLLNAVMHRDYASPGGYVAIAIFDDRVEFRSIGRLPHGITADMLSGPHLSRLRNPLIADAFHRTGAVEIWGRGTNRVIAECQRYGLEPPTFEEISDALVVTIRAPIGPEAESVGSRPGQDRATESRLAGRPRGRGEKILAILRWSGPLPAAAILDELDEAITRRALQKELKRLKEAGDVATTGRGRSTTYYLPDAES